jgi:hypothetical protein
MPSEDDIAEEFQEQRKLFRPLENSNASIDKNVGCIGGLLVLMWVTLLVILWRVW